MQNERARMPWGVCALRYDGGYGYQTPTYFDDELTAALADTWRRSIATTAIAWSVLKRSSVETTGARVL